MIHIRHHVRSDIKYRVKWLNNLNATIFAIDNHEKGTTVELQTSWFDRYEADANKEFFTIEVDGQPVGFTGLSGIDKIVGTAKLFILIGEDDFRGKGYGEQALSWLINYAWHELDLKNITLEVKTGNTVAIRLYEKHGFTVIEESKNESKMILLKSEK